MALCNGRESRLPKFTKEEFREQVKQRFDINSYRADQNPTCFDPNAGKLGRKIEEAASKVIGPRPIVSLNPAIGPSSLPRWPVTMSANRPN